ncbi:MULTISPECIES: hypothetical protein [Burkholderia]|uniref:hypothetical protein n=1 Tax=Burkholderia TaxID=32008 RepID=UPI00054FC31E|nr:MULTISPECIES: hypothetical protein [Burkholderia]AOJ13166.1 hypothetical protein WJ02_05980 [Burkholderia vietnamiensis]TCT31935.1 hypothetical protein EC918_102162 [Burkholderia vietnamiensis]SCZ28212.1 hypothetical protein SAMN02787148_106274 [Burkholderia vietnamiensis]SFX63553.1 hypothetical protein SAMN02787160_106275 [Burkholderia vietnamiensis]HDR9256394.1 hypothetical protein [Burkholderia vietnamiensis]
MSLRDLIAGVDGKLSHTKLWPNVASAVATAVFAFKGYKGTLVVEEWYAYLACVGGYSAVITGISAFARKPASGGSNDQ